MYDGGEAVELLRRQVDREHVSVCGDDCERNVRRGEPRVPGVAGVNTQLPWVQQKPSSTCLHLQHEPRKDVKLLWMGGLKKRIKSRTGTKISHPESWIFIDPAGDVTLVYVYVTRAKSVMLAKTMPLISVLC